MASRLSLALLAVVFVASSELFVSGKPSSDNSKQENFWPDKCAKSGTSSGNSSGKSKRSTEEDDSLEKEEICPIWASWQQKFGGVCKASGSVCALQIYNKKTKKIFDATRQICTGGCPAGSECNVDEDFCTNNPGSFSCIPGAFTNQGQLASVSTCQQIPTTTTPAPTTTTTTPTTTISTTTIGGFPAGPILPVG